MTPTHALQSIIAEMREYAKDRWAHIDINRVDTNDELLILFANRLEALTAQPAEGMMWIPVSERLPGSPYDVMVFDGKFVWMGWRRNDGQWFEYVETGQVPHSGVTHWQPLPSPPAALSKPIQDYDKSIGEFSHPSQSTEVQG